jgi:hypothetical protein
MTHKKFSENDETNVEDRIDDSCIMMKEENR